VKAIEGVNLILGTAEKHHLFDHLDGINDSREPLVFVNDSGEMDSYDESLFVSSSTRTRAFLKIQEGCNYYCSYCIIPFARGKARSRSYVSTIEEAKRLVGEGFREIVLTGINVGTYQHENGEITHLHDLLSGLSDIDGLERIRVSSIEPNTITDDLLHLVKERENICPHLHVPLQSGSDTILETMQRKYTIKEYLEVIERIRTILPDTALGTDVIVGYPGETEKLFQETAERVAELPFTYLHIFRYSPREGTVAARMTEQVPEPVKKERSAVLREIGIKKKKQYAQRFVGKTMPILVENRLDDGNYSGLTPNYLRTMVNMAKSTEQRASFTNTIILARLIERNGFNLVGELHHE
jgi:threonylcarbamoyladenosine tRNA methylthiotransferase MtaB